MTTKQEKLWRGNFGEQYTERNTFASLEEFNQIYVDRFGLTKAELIQRSLGDLIYNDARILEVGANVGYQLLNLQKAGFKRLFGVEIQREAIEKGKAYHKNIDIVEGTALDVPFKDEFFDLVFTETLLIHISPNNLNKALDEIYRCTRKFIWGFEYFSELDIEVEYHGHAQMVWKANFSQKFLRRFPDLDLIKEERLRYLNERDKLASLYLLQKK